MKELQYFPEFIKVPCVLHDKKQEELMGKEECIDSFYMVNPYFIVSYMECGYDRDGQHPMGTFIQTANHGIQSPLLINDFEELLNKVKLKQINIL